MRPMPLRRWIVSSVVLVLPLLGACSAKEAEAKGPAVDVTAAITGIAACRDTDGARLKTAYALIEKHPDGETLPLIVPELDSAEPVRRRAAIHALGMLVWDDPKPAFAPLVKLLAHADPFTRGQAAIALASLGDTAAYEGILAMVKGDKDSFARYSAAWALGELGDPRAVDELKALQDEDPKVQLYIEDALHRLAFQADHAKDEGQARIAAQAVDKIAGANKDQLERLERELARLQKCEPEATKKLLASWKAGKNRPKLASAAEWALANFDKK